MVEIKVDDKNPFYRSQSGTLLDKAGSCLVTCPAGLDEFEWPEGLRYVDQRAFAGCRRLTEGEGCFWTSRENHFFGARKRCLWLKFQAR